MSTLQNLFLREKSFEGFDNETALELMLSTAEVGGDIPAIISSLFATFGSFKGILEAHPSQLMNVPGISLKAATLISMIVPLAKVWERCSLTIPDQITNRHEAEAFCKSLLIGERAEHFHLICVNAQCRVIGTRKIADGSLSEVSVIPRTVMETALAYNAHSVFFCHNHPGCTCSPSREDIVTTVQLQRMLSTVDIPVLDHIIVAGSACYSMAQHGDLEFGRR